MCDEGIITIEIRGREAAAMDAAERIAGLFLSSGPGRPSRTPGEDEVRVLVHADVSRRSEEGGIPDPAEEPSGTL
ncbi:DUF6207 family protein [Streptomyces sp. NPDC051079]|uniref:DUF6207 family protein n=1 Tax=Streptomyces sp. NPDC051079 TaxID=3155043 RepID=UPI00344D6E82